jgi:AbrB family looped-hinge helix DNA binding protein
MWYNGIMNTTLTLDKAGRIVLPKPVRDELQLSPGDALEVESSEEQIVLRPARGRGHMKKESGVWVYDSGEALSAETVQKTMGKVRDQRQRKALGHAD